MISLLTFSWLDFTVVVERLGWVLLHSLWQFALVALLAGVTVRALRRRSASTRYVVLVVAMAVSVAVPAATWMLQHGEASEHWTSRKVSPDTADEASWRVPPSNLADDPTLASAAPVETPIPGHTGSRTAVQEVPRQTPMEGVTAPPPLEQARTISQRWLAWIVAGWSLGVVICSLRPLLGWHTLRRLRSVGVSPVLDEVLTVTQRLSNRLGLRRAVLVLQSTLARTPIVVGYVRPVILLPVCLLTSIPAAQLEAILAHELAHVRRHDFVVNLLQTLVETLFFYHPAVWWLSRQIRIEREHCCDDQVVALLGNRVEYGRALVAVEELQGRHLVLALGVNDGSLLARIRRIVGVGPDCTPHERWPAALLGLVLLGAMCALSITWSVAAPDDVRHEPQPVVGPTPEREKGQLQELVGWSADSAQVFTTTTFIRLMRWERNGTALKLKASEIPGNEAFAHANSMAIASKSGRIILGTNRGTVQFWDAAALEVQKQIAVEPDTDRYATYAVAISPDESVVAEFGRSGHLYDMATMKCICFYGEREKRRMSVLAFSPDGRTLVGLDWDGLLTLWNIPDGTKIADWPLQHIAQHATVQWSPDGDRIAVVSDGTVAFVTPTLGSTPRVVIAPDAVCQMTPEETLIESRTRRADLPDGIDFAGVMALAPDFKTVASVKIDASVAIWDAETREVISHLAAPPSARNVEYAGVYMQRLTFSPNGRHLACTRDIEGDLIWWTLRDEPVESARVRIRSADGSPAALNGLVNASVGFSALKVPAWSVFATRAGVVPLDDLPPGTHWLVAKADSEERTVFQVTLPRPGAMIERRLRSPAGWVSKEIELKPSVDRTDPDDEMIVVELHNASGANITVTADDFSLTMSPNPYRVFAPHRRSADTGDATRLTIANGESGTMRLSWHRWIREGLWASRIFEHVAEPWSPNSDAGKIQVRVNLGNRGSLPIFVTAPNVIAAARRPEATDEAAAFKPFECEIVDAVTGKLIEEAEFHFSFHFMKPATKDMPPKEVGHAIWAPKASSKFSFVIPDKVLQHPDRDKLVVEWFVRHPKYETLVSKEPVSLLSVLMDEPKSARDTFRTIKLTPKKETGAIRPAERSKAFDAAFLIQSLAATGKYLATARPKQPELMVGEPGWISFDVHNQTDIDKRVIVGGDYRNALGRPDSFKVDVFDADGRRVAQPSIGFDMGGISHPVPLPAKQSAGFELFLPHWATITKPGKYRFTVWRELPVIPSEKDSAGQDPFALKPDKVLVAAETAFTVVARDEAKFGELIERLGPMLIRGDESQLADQMLRAIRVPLEWSQRAASTPDTGELAPDERAVPWYLKYLAQTHSARKRTALRFLGECRSEMAFDAIVKSLDVTADDIRGAPTRELAESSARGVHQAATHALATFATNQPLHPRATNRLFALADHPHMPVRLTVLHFAAKVKTREARAIIETMTDDKNERLATEAKRYQKLLADEDG